MKKVLITLVVIATIFLLIPLVGNKIIESELKNNNNS